MNYVQRVKELHENLETIVVLEINIFDPYMKDNLEPLLK